MFPFHRLTEEGRRAFAHAQEEAVRRGAQATGTEHLLLALLRDQDCLAARALAALGVGVEDVRQALGSADRPPTRMREAALPPTDKVERAIQTAFEDAKRRDDQYVGTEHLLVGLLAVEDGRAAQVLAGIGVAPAAVAAEVDRLRPAGPERSPASPAPSAPPATVELVALLEAAQRVAEAEMAPWVRPDHVLRVMAEDPASAAALAAIGADVPSIVPRLTPPTELATRQRAARDLRARREAAAGHQDYERAAQLRDAEQAALTEYHRALNRWLTSLDGSR